MSSAVSAAGNISSRKTSTVFSVSSLPSRHKFPFQVPRLKPNHEVQPSRKALPTRQQPKIGSAPQTPAPAVRAAPAAAVPTSSRARRPATRQQSFGGKKTPVPIDTHHVVSKLKQDRNYQPPRQKKLVSQAVEAGRERQSGPQRQHQHQQHQSSSDNADDYEDDFEAEPDDLEDEEEGTDSDTAMMKSKQAWLFDQFRRVRARQRAALMVKRQESGAEKASSKDSAYGYSCGETSRLHTREPTPDYHPGVLQKQAHPNRPRIKQRMVPARKNLNHNPAAVTSLRGPLVPKPMAQLQHKEQVPDIFLNYWLKPKTPKVAFCLTRKDYGRLTLTIDKWAGNN